MAVAEALTATFGADAGVVGKQETLTAVHAAARARGWRVGTVHWNKYPMSFHWIALETEDGPVAMLVHADRAVAALTPGEPKYMALSYLDDAAFAQALAACGASFLLLGATELGQTLDDRDIDFVRALGRDFAYNLDYWKPKAAGEVIFNWWD